MTIKENYTRVTEVLYPFSGLSKIDPHIVKNAAERGSRVHELCDALINDLGILDMDNKLAGYLTSFEKWAANKEFLVKPSRFYCDKYMITGECDGIYKDGNDLILFDLKTPLRESKTWPLQCSAYAYMARRDGYNIKRVEVIKLCQTGKEPTVYTYEENFDLFLKCLDIYRHFFAGKQEDFLQVI